MPYAGDPTLDVRNENLSLNQIRAKELDDEAYRENIEEHVHQMPLDDEDELDFEDLDDDPDVNEETIKRDRKAETCLDEFDKPIKKKVK